MSATRVPSPAPRKTFSLAARELVEKLDRLNKLFAWSEPQSLGRPHLATTFKEVCITGDRSLAQLAAAQWPNERPLRSDSLVEDALLDASLDDDPKLLLRLVEENTRFGVLGECMNLRVLAVEAATSRARPELAEALQRVVAPESPSTGLQHPLLCRAITSAADDVPFFLLNPGVNANEVCPGDGMTPLQIAERHERPWLVEALQSCGAVDPLAHTWRCPTAEPTEPDGSKVSWYGDEDRQILRTVESEVRTERHPNWKT